MLVVETVVRIRREHAGGKSIRAIARDLRLSRKAVRKAIGAPEGAFTYHRTVQPLPRIGPFQERLDTLLTENEGLPRRDRLRMTEQVVDRLESVEIDVEQRDPLLIASGTGQGLSQAVVIKRAIG